VPPITKLTHIMTLLTNKISIGSDHAGFDSKKSIKDYLLTLEIDFFDFGCFSEDSVDYPDYAHKVSKSIESNDFEFGILICGSGQGVNMTANKYKGVRSALCWSEEIARLSRQHNNANVLCLPGRFLTSDELNKITYTFLTTSFEGGRHQKRVEKISQFI